MVIIIGLFYVNFCKILTTKIIHLSKLSDHASAHFRFFLILYFIMIYMIFILPSTNKMQNNFTVFLFHFFDDDLCFCQTPVLSLGLGVNGMVSHPTISRMVTHHPIYGHPPYQGCSLTHYFQDGHPSSNGWSPIIKWTVTHHPKYGYPPSPELSATITRMVPHNPK